jgi:hypothetical protein
MRKKSLLAQSGHWLVRRTCLLLTQSGHGDCIEGRASADLKNCSAMKIEGREEWSVVYTVTFTALRTCAPFITSGSGDGHSATNSDGDGDGDNTRSSGLSNERRLR